MVVVRASSRNQSTVLTMKGWPMELKMIAEATILNEAEPGGPQAVRVS